MISKQIRITLRDTRKQASKTLRAIQPNRTSLKEYLTFNQYDHHVFLRKVRSFPRGKCFLIGWTHFDTTSAIGKTFMISTPDSISSMRCTIASVECSIPNPCGMTSHHLREGATQAGLNGTSLPYLFADIADPRVYRRSAS